jgi:type I restriction enzyme S subunit
MAESQVNFSNSTLLDVPLELPPLAEQMRIAEILDTMDEAIRRTEQLIAKLKHVNQGLLNDLLTRGIDENGELRDPARHRDKFEDSPVGPIPRTWSASRLGDEFTLQRGFDITVAEQRPGDVPVVSSSGITSYHNEAMVAGPGVVTGRKGKLGDAYFLDRPFWPHDTTLWVKNFHGNDVRFGALFLRSLRLERFDAATSVPTLNRNFVHPLRVAIPPLEEQHRIVAVAGAAEARIGEEERTAQKLRLLKEGLMDDLLTGRVRVTKLLDEKAA